VPIRLGEGQPHFGPKVYCDENVGDEYAPVDFDVVSMGENLKIDFPEISQAEWDNVMVYLTDGLPTSVGGFSANTLPLKESFSARVLLSAQQRIREFFTGRSSIPSMKHIQKIAGEHDVFVAVNLASEAKERVSKTGRFFPKGEKYDSNTILAHELQHTAGHLTNNRIHESQGAALRKWYRHAVTYMGSIITGLATGTAGAITDIVAVSPLDRTAVLIGGGGVASGVAMVAAPIYLMAKRKTLSMDRFGIDVPEPPYSGGEDSANGYALATQDRWRGVICLSGKAE